MTSYPNRSIAIAVSGQLRDNESIQWACSELEHAYRKSLTEGEQQASAAPSTHANSTYGTEHAITELITIKAMLFSDETAAALLNEAGLKEPSTSESFSIIQHSLTHTIYVIGHDCNGLIYGLLELADRINCTNHSEAAWAALTNLASITEKTDMPVRSITRLFVSEVEDKQWYYDRTFWDEYLTELVMQRFNRFHLALGIGYDSGHDPNVVDNYFCFAYPFLLQLPQYNVEAAHLSQQEMKRNLETLQYISQQAKLRGLHFQLGLWTHAHDFQHSPNLRYPIAGITKENHALYCRDALQALLHACPAIDGVTFRVHYESGIPEPASEFWRVVLEGAGRSGQRVEIDMHAKGVDEQLIETAVKSGSPVVISAKYAAEHMGLPYHQADIRPLEKPRTGKTALGFDALTAAARRFTRYGYGDFLHQPRSFDVIYRVWPGTQRLLLWGDPALAAAFGRFGRFGGAKGIEWFEPLSFKARKDSGTIDGRDPYADLSLRLNDGQWKKYKYTYRLWGRLMYNPDSKPDSWRRYLALIFGDSASYVERALAVASKILPLVTTASHPSAANNVYWPEMYTNQPIVEGQAATDGDFDTPAPYTFGAASPLDPQLFYTIDRFVKDQLAGELNGKLTPLEVADRLLSFAEEAQLNLAKFNEQNEAAETYAAEWKRYQVDISALSYIGRFFAFKIKAAVQYAYYQNISDPQCLYLALNDYNAAKEAWEQVVQTTSVYKEDITFGFKPYARGHWRDRLKEITKDIFEMERVYLDSLLAGKEPTMSCKDIPELLPAASIELKHTPPEPSWGKSIKLHLEYLEADETTKVKVYYRIAHQAMDYESVDMIREKTDYYAVIPHSYTTTGYQLLYYFVIQKEDNTATLYPGLNAELSNQPYYALTMPQQEG